MNIQVIVDPSGKTLIDPSKDCVLHQIELPEGLHNIAIYEYETHRGAQLLIADIPLRRPRKKVKKTGWINIYKINRDPTTSHTIWPTETEALCARDMRNWIATTHISYEVEEV
jgi:hypothetical protein